MPRIAKFTLALLALLLLTVACDQSPATPTPAPTAETAQACAVSANYQEALDENSLALLKLLAMTSSNSSPLDKEDNLGTFYAQLLSMRHYHEEIAADLPPCAEEINQETIKTIAATQDVLTWKLVLSTNPSNRNESRLARAQQHLNDSWQSFSRQMDQSGLSLLDGRG